MKKGLGILLTVLLLFTVVSCSFFIEEKEDKSLSRVSFGLAGKLSKADSSIKESITYGESTVLYGTWSDLGWNIWYLVTDTDNDLLYTTSSEVSELIHASDTDWISYNNTPFRVEKGKRVWAYCENDLSKAKNSNKVATAMFKAVSGKKIEETKTLITLVPEIDENVAFKKDTTGTLKIDKLTYIMSEPQYETLDSPTDMRMLKATIKVGGKEYSTVTDLHFNGSEPLNYGYAVFGDIEIEGIDVSESGTTASDIVVEFIGMKDKDTTATDCLEQNMFELSNPEEGVVKAYILNNLTTELESLTVQNKEIGLAVVYINTTDTDLFPEDYDLSVYQPTQAKMLYNIPHEKRSN